MAFLFKIQIKGITSPPVWRRVLVPDQFSFYQFHEVIQAAFGWLDAHLFQFSENGFGSHEAIGVPDPDYDESDTRDSKKVKIKEVFGYEGQKYTYIYDFGDHWLHTILLEKMTSSKILKADCVDGKGMCPPEDCGGIYGYASLKEILADPKDLEHEAMKEWLGMEDDEVWDAKFFDLDNTKKAVRGV